MSETRRNKGNKPYGYYRMEVWAEGRTRHCIITDKWVPITTDDQRSSYKPLKGHQETAAL
jgi:hypothetical protein